MSNDTIACMITSLRNANMKKAITVQLPATNISRRIGKILLREGFINNLREHKDQNKNFLTLTLKYRGRRKEPYITSLRVISKPGLKIYSGHREIPKVLGGMGIVILSTPFGIMTDREARENQVGGEVLCYIW
uniref:ribosomal protein S8 n=1 Tax=Equisetum pratense TaxID=231681 RepID=UPI0030FE6B71